MTDAEDQSDEICALKSIYNEEEFTSSEVDNVKTGTFSAFLTLPRDFHVVYNQSAGLEDAARPPNSVVIPVQYLPPIMLSFKLPNNYPSTCMPEFTLSCCWIPIKKLITLCGKLEDLWKECGNSPVLFTWINFLKEELLEWLGLTNVLDISAKYAIDMKRSRQAARRNNNPSPNRREPNQRRIARKPKPILDPRVASIPLTIPLHEFIDNFNEERTHKVFLTSYFRCFICFQDASGSKCLKFKPCGHIYCNQCMEQYFRTRISESLIASMPCPHDKCSSEANPQQVKDVVGSELFNKYDKLLLNITLEKMDDITHCPRKQCQSVVLRDGEDKMAACPNCNYVFCVFCKRSYHGVAPCRFKSEELHQLVKEYQEGDEAVKKRLINLYGINQINAFINDSLSNVWLKDNSKNCPKCNVSIEKALGCNKMVCGKCQTHFCWLCLQIVDPERPYDHYNTPGIGCNGLLLAGVGPDEDEDDDFIIFGHNVLEYDYEIDSDEYDDPPDYDIYDLIN